MEYRFLGRTGVQVSALCFGTMSFGSTADEAESKKMFERCLDAGINFFDCADVYAGGQSEEILGRLMKGKRENLIITSKVWGATGKDRNQRGLSRRHIVSAVEASLRRLDTDRLDLYFVHKFDPHTPIEETLRALDDLVRQGKVLYLGVSNWAAWQIAKALGLSDKYAWARFECIQPMYSLVKRQAEVEILPLAASEEVGVIAYSPLGGGLLTGKYDDPGKQTAGRLTEQATYRKRYDNVAYYETARKLSRYAGEKGIHPATLAVAWVKDHPAVTAPIIGARDVRQLEPSLAAAEVKLDSGLWRELATLSETPPPATDRSEEA